MCELKLEQHLLGIVLWWNQMTSELPTFNGGNSKIKQFSESCDFLGIILIPVGYSLDKIHGSLAGITKQ